MKKLIILGLVALFTFSACNDDFLEKRPITEQSEAALVKYENFMTYSWRFYDIFTASNHVFTWSDAGISAQSWGNSHGDIMANFMVSGFENAPDTPWRRRQMTVPAGRNGGGWDYSFIRSVHIMLRNIDNSEMSQTDKDHWRSVGYFFLAYRYAELISRFGDIIWVSHVLGDDGADDHIIFGPRMPRKEAADNVLELLQFAEQNIKENGDGRNTINRAVVQAMISRFGLFEGTWRRYHGLGDEAKHLEESLRASQLLMALVPAIDNNFDGLLTTLNLSNRPGSFLFKEYDTNWDLGHMFARHERSTSTHLAGHRFITDMYLVQSNGLPVTNVANTGRPDIDMYDEFRDRDPRLLITFAPPYAQARRYTNFPGQQAPAFVMPDNAAWNTNHYYYRPGQDPEEYFKWLAANVPGATNTGLTKTLPAWQFQGTAMIWSVPNFPSTPQQQFRTETGYIGWRHYSLRDTPNPVAGNPQGVMASDKPIFFIEEVLLNAAEAAFELSKFDQAMADRTINLLRRRTTVNMPDMIVANISASTDPSNPADVVTPGRDPSVDPVLWEIRRERIVELNTLGFGWADIRRWKRGAWFMDRPILGVKMDRQYYRGFNAQGVLSDTPATNWAWLNRLTLVNKDGSPLAPGETHGYVRRLGNPAIDGTGGGWDDAFYLFPLPTYDLNMNENLTQNPGWERY
jgi:hypothetical protein